MKKKKIRGKLVFAFSCRVQPKTCFERSLCRKLFSNYLNRDLIRILKDVFLSIAGWDSFEKLTRSRSSKLIETDQVNFYFCSDEESCSGWIFISVCGSKFVFFLIKNGKRSMFDEDFQVVGVSKRNNSMKIKWVNHFDCCLNIVLFSITTVLSKVRQHLRWIYIPGLVSNR